MSYVPTPAGGRSRTRDSAAATTSTRADARDRGNNGSAKRQRSKSATAAPAPARAKTAPRGHSFDEPRNWKQLGMLAGGIAAGAAIGSAIALLMTDKTGPQRRAGIARRARHLGHDAEQRWEDLGFALKEAARSARDRFRHRQAADGETDVDD